MSIQIIVRDPAGRPAAGISIQAKGLARPVAGRRRIEAAPSVAVARTDGEGRCDLDIPPSAARFIALLFIGPNNSEALDLLGPMDIDKLPKQLAHQLAKAPPGDAPATDPDKAPAGGDKPPGNKPRASYADTLRRRRELNDKLNGELGAAIGEALDARTRGRKSRKPRIRQLMGEAPRAAGARAAQNFVAPGENAAAKAAEVRARSLKAMRDGDARRRGVFVPLQFLPPDFRNATSGPAAGALLRRLMAKLMSGNAARRRTSLLEKMRARRQAQSAVAAMSAKSSPPNAPTESAPPPDKPSSPPNLEALIAAILAGSGTEGAIGTRPNQDSVTSDIAGSEVPTGPADSIAYYDYNVLKIAWEDTWTAVVDDYAERELAELYDSIVELVPSDKNKEKLEEELAEVEELHDLLDTIGLTADVMSSSLLAPPELTAWNERIAKKWTYLDPVQQSQMQFYYEVDQVCSLVQALPEPNKNALNDKHLSELEELSGYNDDWFGSDPTVKAAYDSDWAENQAEALLKDTETAKGPRLGRVEEMVTDLKQKIAKPYRFDIFAPDSYNFGILATYRQQWTPKNYQPGDLAGTITLAPNERRKFTLRRKTAEKSTSRSERTIASSSKSETEEKSRIESEIARSTQNKLNAGAGATVGLDMFVEASSTTNVGYDQGADSAQKKNDIREATRKSAQEFRDERKLELTGETSSESEYTEEREITNPNNELTVTYLFYELQRQYTVCERLYNVFPVIYVAFDVPAPHQVDEAWLLEHEWIVRDVLLDDTLRPTLQLLSQDLAGDEVAVEALEEQWKIQIAVVAELRQQLSAHVEMRESARRSIERAAERARIAQAEADKKSPLEVVGDVAMTAVGGVGAYLASELLDRTGKPANAPATAMPDETARQALDWADNDLSRAESALRAAMTALEVATDKYILAFRARLNRRVQVDRLILHVKSNILHYMQAIWSREHPDQRYMRLYDLDVQWPGDEADVRYVTSNDIQAVPAMNRPSGPKTSRPTKKPPGGPGGPAARTAATGSVDIDRDQLLPDDAVIFQIQTPQFKESRKLHQIADIDNILAFKGNYAVFRLRESNALTAYLLQDFLDGEFGLVDPDPLGELPTADEAIQLAEQAWNEPDTTDEDKAEIADWLVRMLEAAHQVSQDIVVPTGQLFIEALPGAHPLLEDFKLKHRQMDLQKASAEARMSEVELVRRAARLLAGERDDPDIDKRIQVSGIANGALNVDTNA
jgi:hypothetical protein